MATYENLKAILSLLGREVKKNPLKALDETAQLVNNPYAMGVSGKAAYDEYMKGNYPMAGINTGAMMLGAVPVVGPLASRGLRTAGKVAKEKLPSVFNMPATLASKGAAPLSEAAQVNKLIANNADKFNTKDFYEFSRNKFRQKYINEFDNDPSMQFMSYMHSSKRPDLTLDNFNFGSTKTKDFSDDLKHKAIAPDSVFSQGQGGIFAKQVADADNFLTDPYYRDFLNRYIVTSGYKKPPPGPGSMSLERKAGAPMSQKMGLRQRSPDGTITVTPTTKVPMNEYFIPERAIRDTGGIDKVYSLENVTDYLRSLK